MSDFPGVATGSFVVATIDFLTTGLGTSALGLAASNNEWASDGALINPTFDQTASVTVTAVPLPGALWLFGSGLLGIFGMAKRKKA